MNTLKLIISIVILIIELFLIWIILLQPGNRSGMGAISGTAETYFTKGRNKTREDKLSLLTKIGVIVMLVLIVTLIILSRFAA